jgi:hypothetical protein
MAVFDLKHIISLLVLISMGCLAEPIAEKPQGSHFTRTKVYRVEIRFSRNHRI